MRHVTLGAALAVAVLLAAAAPASAQPAEIPIQGTLTDAGGVPLSGTHTVVFSLYATQSGGTALFSETHSVAVDQGAFTVYLGSIDSLDLGLFSGAKLYVGVKVGSDDEMSPRLPLGSVPYAAYAKETAAVPAGAVMFFNLAQCPPGWSELTAARGRAVVALPGEGMLAGTVGTALADRENRTHTHSVTATIAAGTGTHTHSIVIPGHRHIWSHFSSTSRWRTHHANGALGDISGTIQHTSGTATPLSSLLGFIGATSQGIDYYTSSTTNQTVGTGTSGGHSHAVTTSVGNATTGQAMPYIQLLACVKS